MKKILLATLAVLAMASFTTNANAQAKYQGEVNASIGAAFLGAGYDVTFLKAGLETVHGVRIESFFVGAGLGIHEYVYFENETYDAELPIFANFKYYFGDQRVSPYAGLDVGYGIGLQSETPSGLYLSPSIGVNFRLGSKLGLHAGLTYQLQDWGKDYYGDRMLLHGIAAKVGFTW